MLCAPTPEFDRKPYRQPAGTPCRFCGSREALAETIDLPHPEFASDLMKKRFEEREEVARVGRIVTGGIKATREAEMSRFILFHPERARTGLIPDPPSA
jgi:hypothetical protein